MVVLCGWQQAAFCNSKGSLSNVKEQLESLKNEIDVCGENQENAELRKTILKTNIRFLECNILKKLKRTESRLEKYKNKVNSSEDEEEAAHWLKKIESAQKKIADLNDLIMAIEMLKVRLGN